MPQIVMPLFPHGTTHINNLLAFSCEEGTVTYFNGSMPLFSHRETDVASFHMIIAQFYLNGHVKQVDICRAFGVTAISVKRAVKLHREQGVNLDELRRIVKDLNGRGVAVKFEKEALTSSGESSPMANLMLSMLGAVAEFERALILDRQREGIAIAKSEGKYLGRRSSLTDEQIRAKRNRAAAGESKTAIARDFGISRETLYQKIRYPTERDFLVPRHELVIQ